EPEQSPPDQGAGASAEREYERRRQNRIDRSRRRYGSIGGWVAERSRGPQHERAWLEGARGERKTGQRLEEQLGGEGVLFLHDRRIPGRKSNFDHIVIGPGGVFVVDSKKYTGNVRVRAQGGLFSERQTDLYVNGRRRPKVVEGVERQIDDVRRVLSDEGL